MLLDKSMQERKRSGELAPGRPWMIQGYTVWMTNRRRFEPPTDVIELADKIIVVVEIAGMRAHEFNVALNGTQLVISGTRERPMLQNAAYHQVEINYGEFRVELTFTWNLSSNGVTAAYRDGFLQVELPRMPENRIHVVGEDEEPHE
ncbi:MAG: Hsp20/alpha crystallin family protein [Anaerolinea sp.]|nr:Hsp20/alpha crystallin family protein [Anaerolinea sp.]